MTGGDTLQAAQIWMLQHYAGNWQTDVCTQIWTTLAMKSLLKSICCVDLFNVCRAKLGRIMYLREVYCQAVCGSWGGTR